MEIYIIDENKKLTGDTIDLRHPNYSGINMQDIMPDIMGNAGSITWLSDEYGAKLPCMTQESIDWWQDWAQRDAIAQDALNELSYEDKHNIMSSINCDLGDEPEAILQAIKELQGN